MHVSRVAAVLLRAVRRSRRPLAIALVATIVAGICVITDVSGAAMAAEQPKNASSDTPAASSAAGDTSATITSSASSSSSSTSSSGSASTPSKGSTSSTASGHSTTGSKPAAHSTAKSKPVVMTRAASVNKPLLAPVLTLSGTAKVADTNHDGRTSPGDVVTITWTVTNTGPDPATATSIAVSRGSGTCSDPIAGNSSGKCTTTTTLKQSDLDAAQVSVTGTVNATVNGSPSKSDAATAKLSLKVVSGLQISQRILRVSDRDHNGRTSKGDVVEFVFSVKNTGTQTVHSLHISDVRAAQAHVAIHCTATTLAPKAHTTCTSGGYVVTGGQAKKGFLENSGRALATTTAGKHVSSRLSSASIGVQKPPPPAHPRLALTVFVAHVGTAGGPGAVAAGDTITYGFRISNVGNVSISGISLTDKNLARQKVAIHCGSFTLSAGRSTSCTSGPMTITNFQVNRKELTNWASVSGTASNGRTVTASDKIVLGLTGSVKALVGTEGQPTSLPRTGGVDRTPLILGFWMIMIGFGLVVAGRRPGQTSTPAVATERRSWISSRAER